MLNPTSTRAKLTVTAFNDIPQDHDIRNTTKIRQSTNKLNLPLMLQYVSQKKYPFSRPALAHYMGLYFFTC